MSTENVAARLTNAAAYLRAELGKNPAATYAHVSAPILHAIATWLDTEAATAANFEAFHPDDELAGFEDSVRVADLILWEEQP